MKVKSVRKKNLRAHQRGTLIISRRQRRYGLNGELGGGGGDQGINLERIKTREHTHRRRSEKEGYLL